MAQLPKSAYSETASGTWIWTVTKHGIRQQMLSVISAYRAMLRWSVTGTAPALPKDISLLNPLRLPPEIQKSIDEQFAAQQAAQTAESNRRKVEAEAASNVAKAKGEAQVTIEQARAEAESNRLLANSITPQLLELERLRVERVRVEKWNGQQANIIQTPNVQLGSGTSGGTP